MKLAESLAIPLGTFTRRDIRLPKISGKAFAVIGVRRGGKTSFLRRRVAECIGGGRPRESQLLLSLEDERLVGMTAADLGWLLDEHARQFPGLRESGELTVYLDEVQIVSGWETLVRRLVDTGATQVFVSGSSAKLLSREVATSLRGRAMEVLVHRTRSARRCATRVGSQPFHGSGWRRPIAPHSMGPYVATWRKAVSRRHRVWSAGIDSRSSTATSMSWYSGT